MLFARPADYNDFLEKSRALGPVMVFLATSILTAASMIGTVVALLIYSFQTANASVGTCQSLTLLSSAVSFIFVGLYLLAARRNEPVSKTRPPTLPLHGACFMIMRIAFLLWTIASMVILVTTLRMSDCTSMNELCLLQKIDASISVLALVASIAIVCGLENCDDPFKTPSALKIRPKVICRVSYFGDLLDNSASRGQSFDGGERCKREGTLQDILQEKQTKRKPIPDSPALPQRDSCYASVLLGTSPKLNRNIRIAKQTTLVNDTGCETGSSAYSVSDNGASECAYGSGHSSKSWKSKRSLGSSRSRTASGYSWTSGSSETRNHHSATPSSSISSYSRRSPLSTMRTAENPDVAIRTDLLFFPVPRFPSIRERNILSHCHNAALAPLPVAHTRVVQRRPSVVFQRLALPKESMRPHNLKDRIAVRPAGAPPKSSLAVKRRVAGMNIPGSYNKYSAAGYYEDVLDAHTRLIEESILATLKTRALVEQEALVRESTIAVAERKVSGEKSPQLPDVHLEVFEVQEVLSHRLELG